MTLLFADATDADAEELTALREEVAAELAARFGDGAWAQSSTARQLEAMPHRSCVRLGRHRGKIITALRLQTKKPWAINTAYFTPVARPLYLTGMATAVRFQGKGLGRAALEDAHRIATAWPRDAIRLDAYDAAAGAGPFYVKCGYSDRGHVSYKGNPLIYFECVLR